MKLFQGRLDNGKEIIKFTCTGNNECNAIHIVVLHFVVKPVF